MNRFLAFIFLATILFPVGTFAQAQTSNQRFEGVIFSVQGEAVKVEIDGKIVDVQNENITDVNKPQFSKGDKVIVEQLQSGEDGESIYFITDFVRTGPLLILFAIFALLTVLIARKKGFLSLVALVISFIVIAQLLLPQILGKQNPILAILLISIILIPINYYLSHGLNIKTTLAISASAIVLVFTTLLSIFFVEISKLSGFSTEEAGLLAATVGGNIDIRALLIAGIMVGILGILDDITISQVGIAYQLKQVSPKIRFKELFGRTMEVGRDHIASVVNTLILIYTSASLPLLLLFSMNSTSFAQTLNLEIIAEEVIRTLITSIGLILAVPLSTFVASYYFSHRAVGSLKTTPIHVH